MPHSKIGTIREFKTQNFHVVVDAVEEFDLDLSWDENGSTREGLGCIYKSLADFEDHRECGKQNRATIRREGRFQVYRKARPYQNCLSPKDKLKKRGFATRERAEVWAKANAKEAYEIFETGKCGSYFADMVSEVCKEARKAIADYKHIRVREVN